MLQFTLNVPAPYHIRVTLTQSEDIGAAELVQWLDRVIDKYVAPDSEWGVIRQSTRICRLDAKGEKSPHWKHYVICHYLEDSGLKIPEPEEGPINPLT